MPIDNEWKAAERRRWRVLKPHRKIDVGRTLFLFTTAIRIATWSTVNNQMTRRLATSLTLRWTRHCRFSRKATAALCLAPGNARFRSALPRCAQRPYIIANPAPCEPYSRVRRHLSNFWSGSLEMPRTRRTISRDLIDPMSTSNLVLEFLRAEQRRRQWRIVRPTTASLHGGCLINCTTVITGYRRTCCSGQQWPADEEIVHACLAGFYVCWTSWLK